MARFLVVMLKGVLDDQGPDEPPAKDVNVFVTPCEDTREVAAAVKEAREQDRDWRVFEIRGGKTYSRSIVMFQDVEIH